MSRHRGFVSCIHECQSLVVGFTLSLMLLSAGVFGLGLAIQRGVVEPPIMDLRHNGIGIAAYRTHYPDCSSYTQCPPQATVQPQEYYVVWIIQVQVTIDQRYRRTATRLLVVPLQH